MELKCSQSSVKMQSKYSQNSIKMQSKCSQNSVTFWSAYRLKSFQVVFKCAQANRKSYVKSFPQQVRWGIFPIVFMARSQNNARVRTLRVANICQFTSAPSAHGLESFDMENNMFTGFFLVKVIILFFLCLGKADVTFLSLDGWNFFWLDTWIL